jgi:hypothetical protein
MIDEYFIKRLLFNRLLMFVKTREKDKMKKMCYNNKSHSLILFNNSQISHIIGIK